MPNRTTGHPRARAAGIIAIGLAALPVGPVRADPTGDLEEMRRTLRQEIAALRAKEEQLSVEVLRLDQKNKLLDRELRRLRAAGPGPTAQSVANDQAADQTPRAKRRASAPRTDLAQQDAPAQTPAPASPPAQGGNAQDRSAPIAGPSSNEQEAHRALEVATPVSSVGGVLTPRGQIQIIPSLGYDYTAQNQLGVNGFQIIPGITFGNIFVNRLEQDVATAAIGARIGITDRWEANVRVPYVFNHTSTTTSIPTGVNAQQLSVDSTNGDIGDVQAGLSYQINAGNDGWPILIGNFAVKTTTGVSPYEVPIFTTRDPNGNALAGIEKKTPTGTGFYSLSPSLTVIFPTAPGTLFANLLYVNNLGARVNIQDINGGRAASVNLTPGEAVGLTAGIAFALNDRASLSLSYQQQHVFESIAGGVPIGGSAYSFGSFNFGIGYELSQSTRINANVAIGVGPNTPAARLLIEIPYKFSL